TAFAIGVAVALPHCSTNTACPPGATGFTCGFATSVSARTARTVAADTVVTGAALLAVKVAVADTVVPSAAAGSTLTVRSGPPAAPGARSFCTHVIVRAAASNTPPLFADTNVVDVGSVLTSLVPCAVSVPVLPNVSWYETLAPGATGLVAITSV